MKIVTFYLIENQPAVADSLLLAHEQQACEQIAQAWRKGIRTLVLCQDQAQAEKIDEYLWQRERDEFIPHNLVGEGLQSGSPIEIGWSGKRTHGKRALLINLQESFPEFCSVYNEVIDFVPYEQHLKDLARERYKAYKSVGFNLKTISISL